MGVAWPGTLPARFLKAGYRETPRDNVIREEMDVGPSKDRRRATVTPVSVRAQMILTQAQASTFEAYFRTTLLSGTVAFDMPDLLGTTREMFIKEPPDYAQIEDSNLIRVQIVAEYTP
jgi:hypothetical protein